MTTSISKKTAGIVIVSLAIILAFGGCSNPTGSPTRGLGDTTTDTTANYTVSYNSNGADSGAVPFGSQSYEEGETVTVLGNLGDLQKGGYTFIGWNSAPAGDDSTWYAVGAGMTVLKDVTLYAQWTDDPVFTLSYAANGGSGDVPVDDNNYPAGYTATVLDNTGTLQLSGFIFDGWNTIADGSGIRYVFGDSLVISGNVTLYAQWVQVFAVSYNENTDNGIGAVPVDSNRYREGETVTVSDNTGDLQKDGHTFLRWNTQSDGNGIDYAPGTTFMIGSADVTLYAKWTANPVYTLSYNANGATGGSIPAEPTAYEAGEPITVPGNTGGLFRTDHTFAGWNDNADGQGEQYRTGDLLNMPAENVTLYAQWTPPLSQEDDPQETFNSVVEQTILSDPDNGFSAAEDEPGVYVYTKTGGGTLKFWQINASGTISFQVTLTAGPGGTPTGNVDVYLVGSDGAKGELISTTIAGLNETATVQFTIPDSDFQIDFQGGQRDWSIKDFTLTLDD